MTTSHIRIFPHNKKEFPTENSLTMWLLTSLRGSGGVYHLVTADRVKDLPPGSLVLFRYEQNIVGEAIVRKGKEVFQKKLKAMTQSGEVGVYEAQVTFVPSSIRLYAPPIIVKQIEPPGKDLITYPGVYAKLNWTIYARILEFMSRGEFIV